MKASHLSTFSSIRRLIGLASDPVITMEKIRKSYGDFAVLKMGRKNIFFCFHPDLAQDVFQKNQSAFRKSRAVFDQIIPLTGRRGLVQLEGKDGLAHRRLTIKAFSSASLLDYLSRFAENFANFRTDIQTKMTDDSALDLARLCGVPPYLVGVATGSYAYTSSEQSRADLLIFGVKPYCDCLASTLSMNNVLPRGTYVKFDYSSYLEENYIADRQSENYQENTQEKLA